MATVNKKVRAKKISSKSPASKTGIKNATVSKSAKVRFKSDTKQTATLVKAGRTSAANAIRASKALGLPITYMKNGVLYKENADGSKEIIEGVTAKKTVKKNTASPLKKGMVLHAKK